MSFTRDISVSLLLHGSLLAGALLMGGISISQQNRFINIILVSETFFEGGILQTDISPAFLPKRQSIPELEQGHQQNGSSLTRAETQEDKPRAIFTDQVGLSNEEPSTENNDRGGGYSSTTSMGKNGGEKEPYYSLNRANSISPRPANSAVQLIKTQIERSLIYPYLAIRKKIEGTVTAEFTVNVKGQPENISIVRSSGYPILDKAAQDTIYRAAPFPAITGSLEIPITYRLEK